MFYTIMTAAVIKHSRLKTSIFKLLKRLGTELLMSVTLSLITDLFACKINSKTTEVCKATQFHDVFAHLGLSVSFNYKTFYTHA